MEILQNPIVVIASIVVVGALCFLLGRKTVHNSKNKALKHLNEANAEILNNLRHGISENQLPHIDLVAHLRVATSIKYSIDTKDLINNTNIINVLSKEIMETPFISAAVKLELCEKLKLLGQTNPVIKEAELIEPETTKTHNSAKKSGKEIKQQRDKNLPRSVFSK